jgi:hypothetical protein
MHCKVFVSITLPRSTRQVGTWIEPFTDPDVNCWIPCLVPPQESCRLPLNRRDPLDSTQLAIPNGDDLPLRYGY